MQNVAISRCCLVTFSKQRQRNEQRIITHAYTAMLPLQLPLPLPLNFAKLNSLKSHKWAKNEQPNEHKTNERPASKKTADSAKNISAMERNQNKGNGVPAISSPVA